MKFKASEKQIEKLKKYLKNGKDVKPTEKGIRNNCESTPTNK